MIFLLTQLLAPPPPAHAIFFEKETAESYYETGTKPAAADLKAANWLQVGGLALYNSERAIWVPGPVGSSESGTFPTLNVFEKKITQLKTKLEFRNEGLVHQTIDPETGNPASQYEVATEEKSNSLSFRLKNEGNWQMASAFPRSTEDFSAAFDCRAKKPNLLICAATLETKNDAFLGPTMKPFVGKIFYYSLYQSGAGQAAASSPPLPPAGNSKGFKCAMAWDGKVEIMSLTMLNKPAKLGKLTMRGIGETWDPKNPKIHDKVILISASDDGYHTDLSILKANSYSGFGPDWPLEKNLQNPAGLMMPGSISIPHGGGYSQVKYPPGWGQGPIWYADTLKTAPTGAQCAEFSVQEPTDPYLWGAGVVP